MGSSGLELSYERRLHHRWEYRRFFDGSQSYRLSECVVFRIVNDRGHFRLGITLKARGSSVERNRVKRKIREEFRILAPALNGFDYNVVVPVTKRLTRPYPEKLGASIRSEFPRAISKDKKPTP